MCFIEANHVKVEFICSIKVAVQCMNLANYESMKQKIEAHHSKLDTNGYLTPLLSHTNSIIIHILHN
jgi:hypothetical protein